MPKFRIIHIKQILITIFLFIAASCAHKITTEESIAILSKKDGLKELVDILAKENLANSKVPGMVIGIITPQDGTHYFSYGYNDKNTHLEMTKDTVFQIGSITKVFTSSLLCILEDEQQMKLKDPISKYMPLNFKPKTEWVSDITLEQLVSHSSGLTAEYYQIEMLMNFTRFLWSGENIWSNLTQKKLLDYIETYNFGPTRSIDYKYSNVAYVLMGTIFDFKFPEKRYENLLKEKIIDPLNLKDTTFLLSKEQESRLASAYSGNTPLLMPRGIKMEPWNFQSGLNAAGGLYSTAPDLMKFLTANMTDKESTLRKSFEKTHERRLKFDKGHVGLGWFIETLEKSKEEAIYHNGVISGHTSYIGYHSETGIGVVVLQNAMNMNYEFGDQLLDTLVLHRK